MRFLLLLLLLPFLGCKGKKPEEPKEVQKRHKEDLSTTRGYLFTDQELFTLDLAQNRLSKLDSFSRIQDVFLCRDTIWVASDSLSWLHDNEIVREILLPPAYREIIKSESGVYTVAGNNLLRIADRRTLTLPNSVVRIRASSGKIWVLDQTGLSIYREADFREELHIPLENPLDFTLTSYGLRVYIASPDRISIFDTQSANHIADIRAEIGEKASLKFVKDKLFCLTESNLYRIDRITNRIENRLRVDNGKHLFLSRSGKYGAVVRDSVITFFDVTREKILKNLKLKVVDVATTLQDSRIYCLTPEELIILDSETFQSIARLDIPGGKKIIIK
jgi:hypothetical protein